VISVLLLAALLALAGIAGSALGDPAAVRAKRAQVQALQAQLAALDAQVERAAEAYNGARWKLGQVQSRIETNRRVLAVATRDLGRARSTLAQRLRAMYLQPKPSLGEILLTSGSIVDAVDRIDLLERVSQQDDHVVGSIRTFRGQVKQARAQLLVDRREAGQQVVSAQQEQSRVQGLLAQRQAVLAGARADLRQAIQEEEARQRRLAELARQRALAAQAAARQQLSLAPQTPLAGPLPSGAGDAQAAAIALRYLGVPYVWGGASPSGFDCSGLASYVYAQIGKSVPHYTGAIWNAFPQVPYDQLQAGDLVFFNGLDHMGIYIGNGQFVHAPHTGDVVRVADLGDRGDYVGAVRP
jgi:cell wall-associated NlpC family hydrolase